MSGDFRHHPTPDTFPAWGALLNLQRVRTSHTWDPHIEGVPLRTEAEVARAFHVAVRNLAAVDGFGIHGVRIFSCLTHPEIEVTEAAWNIASYLINFIIRM